MPAVKTGTLERLPGGAMIASLVAPGLEAVTPRERWESESDCLNLVIPGDGGAVDVPADKLRICSPAFFRADM